MAMVTAPNMKMRELISLVWVGVAVDVVDVVGEKVASCLADIFGCSQMFGQSALYQTQNAVANHLAILVTGV